MENLKKFFITWFIFSVIVLAFAFYIWLLVTVWGHSEPLGVLILVIGLGGFLSAGTVYLDI